MPTIAVDKEDLWHRLGRAYSEIASVVPLSRLLTSGIAATKEFDELMFDFGLELDEDVGDIVLHCKVLRIEYSA